VACSGAERRGKTLDGVSAAIPGGEAAGNKVLTGQIYLVNTGKRVLFRTAYSCLGLSPSFRPSFLCRIIDLWNSKKYNSRQGIKF
jgi:hypothetical protein